MKYQASSMNTLNEELKIPEKYLKWTEDKILAIVHKKWVAGFLNLSPVDFITHNQLDSDEIAAGPSLDELGPDWTRVYIKIYRKRFINARTLAKERCYITTSKKGLELTFAQVLHYVATTNYQHLWKDYYKKYYAPWTTLDQREQSYAMGYSINDVELMKEIINRMYGCLIVKYEDNQLTLVKQADSSKIHCNMLPAIFVAETKTSFVIFYEQTAKYSIRECLTYSPAAITTSYAKPLFLTYQLLKLSRDLRDCGLLLGEITLSDILLMDNFNIQVLPNLEDNIHVLPEITNKENFKSSDINSIKNYKNLNISELCEMWVHGQLSNFDYLTALNDLAGRRYGDPSCHHVMPWVTDFSTRGGGNWRDFTKSKFRLNKGDRQLDLTFDTESEEIGYHVSDVLSEITYYVYLSRRYSRSILCKNVRPLWVPGEYPASISRLYEWTPDECIPQFFTDPSVFKSIHEDLPDLEIPSWATSPEDFIEKHRECLESSYVSERLHHWIDLTFGYKLSGQAAIKSKNVCLHLVDNHTNLSNFGVVQLFTNPHPQKIVPSPFWSKMPPRLRNFSVDEKLITSLDESAKGTNDEHRSSGDEEEAATTSNPTRASPLAFTRFLSRSRSSLPLIDDSSSKSEKPNEQPIVLPKEYNPVSTLIQVETSHAFFNRVNHRAYKPKLSSNKIISNVKQAVLTARLRESQILGCLIIEIFLAEKFRATWKVEKISFEDRLHNSLNLIKTSPILLPKCVKNAVMLLLRVDASSNNYNSDFSETHPCSRPTSPEQSDMSIERDPKVTYMGLPPPSAHQLLEPVLSGLLFPSTKSLQYLYNVVEMIQNYNNLSSELDRATQNIDDENCQEYTRIVFLSKINECKVKAIANELEKLLPNASIATEMSVQLIVPHIRQIFEQPLSVVLAAWHLFDPIARAIGPRETAKVFLKPLMNLYDRGSLMDRLELSNNLPANLVTKFKTVRLYHRSFLLKLIVRLGLKCFLENFITPLVEAVGGYRNHLSGSLNSNFEKAGILKNCPLTVESSNADNVLSPLDEDSSVESEFILSGRNASTPNNSKNNTNRSKSSENEEIFMMETEDKLDTQVVTAQTPQSLDLNLEFNVELEDFTNEVKASVSSSARSPEIPIPPKAFDGSSNKLVPELNSICCKVGSTSTSEDIPYSTIYETPIHDSKSDNSFGNVRDDSVASSTVDPEPSFVYVRKEDILNKRDLSGASEERQRRFNSSECSASEMSAESVIWLSHRLGPVLTARHLSRNLLRMLTLCYFSRENLTPLPFDSDTSDDKEPTVGLRLSGDANASKVLECLTSIVGLYGEHTIVLQYFSHITELVAQCKRKLTPNLEGGLISCIVLLIHLIPYLNDSSLMDVIHEVIVKSILLPTVRILSTSRFSFPNGSMARFVLANKYLEILLILIIRLGNVMAKNHLTVPIQRFFMTFEKVYNFNTGEKHYDVEVRTLRDTSANQKKNETDDSTSPFSNEELNDPDSKKLKALKEVKEVFSASLAHKAYVAFYRLLKDEIMDELVKNHQLVRDLFHEFEQELLFPSSSNIATESKQFLEYNVKGFGRAGGLGIKVKVQDFMTTRCPSVDDSVVREPSPFLAAGRQLRGNWLAYWEHEIGRSDKDTNFNIKQIKLQTFTGHTNSVRCLYVLDNENSFMSGARDRTIKLWSLRSQGDGSVSSSCQYTYNGHKKSILSLTFLESLRYAVTCDGTIHCWDPFMGAFLGCPESPRAVPVNVLAASPAPSTNILVATTDITLRVIDCRTFQYVNEMKVSMSPTGLIRCIAVAPSGHWVALGQASGFLTILDIRTGLIIASWKGHECEILQLETVNETTIISSSLDQTIAVWSAIDGKLKFYLKGVTEPIHCMSVYNQQLISGTTANRIGVHSALEASSPFSFSKLRQDAFKGVLTSMALLPLNRLLLLGADNGNINLIC
ncbi:WD repeat-containing protein 81 isoform X1 [Trichogramma pretiosum]|uniref:WD repeat-containing protein 81 isoform X1 n=1 Tax=Trichogramma pretiosum TaxID=7493 RepID=UPI0006C9DC4E|nr:WD repeat-containing protein 81 isoform X1 [Trichogramma pretiosum]